MTMSDRITDPGIELGAGVPIPKLPPPMLLGLGLAKELGNGARFARIGVLLPPDRSAGLLPGPAEAAEADMEDNRTIALQLRY
jgi:hypothetical protein